MVGLLTVPGLAGKTVPGDVFHRRQGLLPWNEMNFFQDPF